MASLTGHAHAAGTHSLSHAFPAAIQQWKVPLYWASLRTGIPANILGAVMLTESSGDAGAVSPTGAYGLMQVEPSTAAALHCRTIYTPGGNVNCGAKVLRFFINAERGSLFLGLAAYNAGYDLPAGYSYARVVLSRVPRW